MSGDGGSPPPSWAPALLAAHGAVLVLLLVGSAVLHATGVRTGGSGGTRLVTWVLAVATVVLVGRAVGRRRPRRLWSWLAGTAAWAVLPWAWLSVGLAADNPESGWVWVLGVGFSPYGWSWLVPLAAFGAVWTAVLARLSD
ncbi:hypothetical protein JOD57_003097 [Geodermatophilus bullaregiensis]|uniref:hypothetical protein n=1 Tax=Geodermatophilus bullaregiensis TaxID=1564160 RepID=UPI00195C5235|nr:hypothetical protein [Geodermatophilus bullaregiensis]MBM7807260.1 hypothetical protein [Geodermatophilus bullaregiensis]